MRFFALKELDKEISNWPGVTYSINITKGNHNKITFSYGSKTRFVICPKSPSDSKRGTKNIINQVKTTLKELGAIRI